MSAPSHTAPATPVAGAGRRWSTTRPLMVALAGAVVLPLVVTAVLTWTASSTDLFTRRAADARLITAADMEEEYGIRVNLVAVTADGGLVDLRYTVLDKDKAGHILHDAATLPMLLLSDSGTVLHAPQPHAHKLELVDGATYFLLFPNAGGLVQAGAPVSVVIDEVRLEPVAAQS